MLRVLLLKKCLINGHQNGLSIDHSHWMRKILTEREEPGGGAVVALLSTFYVLMKMWL